MEEAFRIPDFSFVHAADLHLDTPFKGLGSSAPAVAEKLREASLQAFDTLVQLCVARRVAFLVVAGDIYDGPERGLRAQLRFRDGLAKLSEAGIRSFVVHGNHDPVEAGWSALSGPWPELVTVFAPGEPAAVTVTRDGTPLATVQGVSFAQRAERENLALRFRRNAGPGVQVGVLHCNVGGPASGYDDYSPCSLEQLRSAGLDYWALGHIHARTVLSGTPGGHEPWVVYPGNLQARSPKPSERGAKGAVVVQVRAGRVAEVEPVSCDVVRFQLVTADVGRLADLAEVRSALSGAARTELRRGEGRSLVVLGQIVGRSDLHYDLSRPGSVPDLLTTLRDEFADEDPFCWWDSIEDRTRPALDLGRTRSGADFAGDLVRLAEELRIRLQHEDGALAELAGELSEGLPGALRSRRRLDEVLADPDDLVERALLLALGELESDRV